MFFDLDRVRDNAAKAMTDDLLDRVTVYRSGMEPEALEVIETELARRGVGPRDIEAHAVSRQGTLRDASGLALRCVVCHQPAVGQSWQMLKVFGILPLIPRRVALCAQHLRKE
jgi:hypothetical protein